MIARRHRDVQLPCGGHELPVGCDDDRRVVAEPVITLGALVEGRVHVGAGLLRELRRKPIGRPTRQLLGIGSRSSRAARIDREVASEGQLLQADQLCPLGRRSPDAVGERARVLFGIGMPALLDRGDPERRPPPRVLARG